MSSRAPRRRKVSVARVYAHVNSKQPESYSDYENLKIEWRYIGHKCDNHLNYYQEGNLVIFMLHFDYYYDECFYFLNMISKKDGKRRK